MFAQKYTAYYGGNPQYKTALANDVFVPCRIRGRDLSGIADWMVRYIEDYQLFNEKNGNSSWRSLPPVAWTAKTTAGGANTGES